MAKATIEIISALERTANKIESGAPYQWGHMGSCNCGNLAQELTKLSKAEIHQYAMQRHGDWTEQILEFCPTSGYPMDLMIQNMLDLGMTTEDLKNLETLSDRKILSYIPFPKRTHLNKNRKEDVVYYIRKWAEMLREEWIELHPGLDLEEAFEVKKLETN